MNDGPSFEATASSENASRRRLLTLMGAGGAAALATLMSSTEAQAGHDGTNTMHLGESNAVAAGSTTSHNANTEGPGLILSNSHSSGSAVHAHQPVGVYVNVDRDALQLENTSTHELAGGISATVHGGPHGVEGVAYPSEEFHKGIGVRGVSTNESGDYGEGPGIGVLGNTGSGVGVHGFSSDNGTGVKGESETGVGVRGLANSTSAIGVRAINNLEGLALAVTGKARFSTAGSGKVPAGENSGFVENAQVTNDSHISVTLTSNPGQREVRWVERNPGSGFTVHMSALPVDKRRRTSFTYLIVEPAEG
jgi:hypothetical protein